MIGIGTILSLAGGVGQAANIYKFVSTLARGGDAERVLGTLDRIHAQVERLNDNILYALGLSPMAGKAQRIQGLREAREILEPVQIALGGKIVSSGLIETPDKMERAMAANPWAVLDDPRPPEFAVRHANPDMAPVLFMHRGVPYIGWHMRGTLPALFNCELRDLPGLGASLTVSSTSAPRTKFEAKASEAKLIYCKRCGASPGSKSMCTGQYTHHDFVTGPANAYCKRCGARPGVQSKCTGQYAHHDFVTGPANAYCKRCGARPGVQSKCTGQYAHHDFVTGPTNAYCKRCGARPGSQSKCTGQYTHHTFVEM